MLVWATAKVNTGNAWLLEALAEHIASEEVVGTFGAQSIANTAWGYARLGLRHDRLLRALAGRCLEDGVLGTFGGQAVANTAWAFATLGVHDDALMTAVSELLRQVCTVAVEPVICHTADALSAPSVPSPPPRVHPPPVSIPPPRGGTVTW